MSESAHHGAGEPETEPPGDQTLESQLRALRTEINLLRDVVDDFMHPADSDPQPGPGDAPFEPLYPSLEQWVVDHFAPVYARPTNPTTRWCAQWWDHAESISRLEALWRSWEVARLDELRGMAVWYRDFLDSQLAVLLSPTGPFASCTPDRHAPTKPLPTSPAPDGYWDDEPDGEPLPDNSPYYQPLLAEQETP
jgi:hypothetical protein